MPTVNNIFNIKISEVANAGSVNIGNTIHKGHNANQKSVGGASVLGDGSVGFSREMNRVADPDFNDQPSNQV